jgi:hypothetical protein
MVTRGVSRKAIGVGRRAARGNRNGLNIRV